MCCQAKTKTHRQRTGRFCYYYDYCTRFTHQIDPLLIQTPPVCHIPTCRIHAKQVLVRTRGERTGSFNFGDTGTTTSTLGTFPSWLPSPAANGNSGAAGRPPQRTKADLSKLFATPEPAVGTGLPLARVVSRGAQGSFGSFPIFVAMCALCAKFAPAVALQSVVAWGVGRVAYWWSMREADVSQRLPAGLVGYMTMFLFLGGLSFLNGLKAVALLA